jgi:hypothetical protein
MGIDGSLIPSFSSKKIGIDGSLILKFSKE